MTVLKKEKKGEELQYWAQ